MGSQTVLISENYCLKRGCASFLLVALAVLFAISLSAAQESEGPSMIPAGVADFEDSPFCQKHECRLATIEPLRLRGERVRVRGPGGRPSERAYLSAPPLRLLGGHQADSI